MGCFLLSLNYFDDKEKVKKRQPHKRKAEKHFKRETLKSIYERFMEFKVKQNLRAGTLNKFVVTYNSIEKYYATYSDHPFYLADLTTDFVSDYV
jgi:integrase/recombinase XerD